MRSISFFLPCAAILLSCYGIVTASVFLPYNANNAAVTRGVSVRHDVNSFSSKRWGSNDLRLVDAILGRKDNIHKALHPPDKAEHAVKPGEEPQSGEEYMALLAGK